MKEVEFTPYAMLLFIHLQFQHDIIHDLHILAGLGKERTDIVAGNIGYNIMEESFLIPSGGGNDISKHKYNLKGGAPPMPYNFDEFLKEFFIIDMEKIMTYEKIESGKVEGVVQRDFDARAAAAAAVVPTWRRREDVMVRLSMGLWKRHGRSLQQPFKLMFELYWLA